MKTITIKNIKGKVLFEHTCEDNTIKITVEEAVRKNISLKMADLEGADLIEANLIEADLRYADLSGADLMTDEWKAYKGLSNTYNHSIVKHGEGEYVKGKAHTNTIEGFWSLLKRGIIGIYHNVSAKHLDAYVDEFEYRYNTKHISCVERFNNMLSLSNSRLTYNQLIG